MWGVFASLNSRGSGNPDARKKMLVLFKLNGGNAWHFLETIR